MSVEMSGGSKIRCGSTVRHHVHHGPVVALSREGRIIDRRISERRHIGLPVDAVRVRVVIGIVNLPFWLLSFIMPSTAALFARLESAVMQRNPEL